MIHERVTMTQMKIACYIAGTVFLAIDISYLYTYAYLLKGRKTRRRDITIAVRSILVLPMIPFYFGVAFEERELLFPSIIGAIYGMFVDATLVGLWFGWMASHSVFDDALLTVLAACSVLGILFMCITILMILKLTEQRREIEMTRQKLGEYALKRFEAIPVSKEMENFILGLDYKTTEKEEYQDDFD